MADITLVRQNQTEISEEDRAVVRRVLFGQVDGLGERGKKQWRRLWNRIFKLQPGEMLDLKTHQERIGWYHRKHMALESAIFEAQERFDDFDAFRAWLKTGSGFVDWYPGPRGGVIPVPRSISYAKLEQAEMEEFHGRAVEFFRTSHAQKTMWPQSPPAHASEAMEAVLREFGE
jgi:hypothetical protein